jgi:DNA-binding CsgD family transcriptional regulator
MPSGQRKGDNAMSTNNLADLFWLHDTYGLTKKEIEVLSLVLSAQSSKQIAANLNIGVPTVEVHRAHLRQKLGVNSTAGVFQTVMAGPRGKGIAMKGRSAAH